METLKPCKLNPKKLNIKSSSSSFRKMGVKQLLAVAAAVFAAAGSDTLVGWNAFAHWRFAGVDVSANLVRLLTHPAFWATSAGWLLASATLALSRLTENRIIRRAAVALAVACVLTGTLVFSGPSPDLFISVIIVAAALLVVG